ncbi:DUF3662 and FHA domain-containing protein [soil metagenome]
MTTVAVHCQAEDRAYVRMTTSMSILRDFEKRLEGAVEGFFARAFRSGLQPVELAKAVQRYEADYQHVGVEAVFVPNVFRFSLSPADLQRFSGFTRSLQRELADVARRTADEKGWRTQGPIRIEFERSDDFRVGTFELRGKSEAVGGNPPAQAAPAPRAEPTPAQAAQPGHDPILRVVDGSDVGKIFPIGRPLTVLGRLPECDITLTGNAISRRHAKIQREGDRWTVTDLGSTNGVRVNSQDVQVSEIKPGDRIEVGDTTFTFLLSGR